MVGKLEWEAIKKQYRNCCAVCGRPEKQVGILEQAHIQPKGKGGSQVFPMDPTCHYMFDNIKLDKGKIMKLGLDWDKYQAGKYSPKKTKPKK